jgi:hypothetical protein
MFTYAKEKDSWGDKERAREREREREKTGSCDSG